MSFYLWIGIDPPAHDVPAPAIRTVIPVSAVYRLQAPSGATMVIRPARGHPLDRAPGELELRGVGSKPRGRAALPRLQFQLMRALCEAALTATDDRSRFVGSRELADSLPFQTTRPEPNHVRQVVSTARATLARAGVADATATDGNGVIQAVEGLGYCVTWAVERVGES
jgi:hypothetical protein